MGGRRILSGLALKFQSVLKCCMHCIDAALLVTLGQGGISRGLLRRDPNELNLRAHRPKALSKVKVETRPLIGVGVLFPPGSLHLVLGGVQIPQIIARERHVRQVGFRIFLRQAAVDILVIAGIPFEPSPSGCGRDLQPPSCYGYWQACHFFHLPLSSPRISAAPVLRDR